MSQLNDFVAVKQSTFVERFSALWQAFDRLCQDNGISMDDDIYTHLQKQKVQKNTKSTKVAIDNYPLISLYRQICEHHALAKQRHYSPRLVNALHKRVMVGHELIYGGKKYTKAGFYGLFFIHFLSDYISMPICFGCRLLYFICR